MRLERGHFWRLHGRKVITIGSICGLVCAFAYGQLSQGHSGYGDFLPDVMPKAASFTSLQTAGGATLYQAQDGSGSSIGFITAAEGPGYGGPMSVFVVWTNDGVITSVKVPQHYEDLPWWKVLIKQDFFGQYVGRSYSEPLLLDDDIDATTGSTVSSNGVAVGVRTGRLVLAEYLGMPYAGPNEPIRIGWPEIAVALGLLLVILFRSLPQLRSRKWPRTISLFYGFIVLGIWLSVPLSLTNIASWLVGYAPHIQTFLVIYLIVFGIIGLAAVFGKNYYCFWLCPYGAVQEVIHLASGGRIRPDPRWFRTLRNTRYVLLVIAVFLVLALKNPSVSVFEPWNVLFSLKGTLDQWVLMVFALLAAVFVYNFWCHYLCPVGAVMEIVIKARKGITSLWRREKKSTAQSISQQSS